MLYAAFLGRHYGKSTDDITSQGSFHSVATSIPVGSSTVSDLDFELSEYSALTYWSFAPMFWIHKMCCRKTLLGAATDGHTEIPLGNCSPPAEPNDDNPCTCLWDHNIYVSSGQIASHQARSKARSSELPFPSGGALSRWLVRKWGVKVKCTSQLEL